MIVTNILSTYSLIELNEEILSMRRKIDYFFSAEYPRKSIFNGNLDIFLKRYNLTRHELRLRMAKKNVVKRAKFQGFVNVSLSVSDEKMLEKLLKSPDDAFDLIDRVLTGQFDIKATYNSEHHNYNVSIMRWDDGNVNSGKIVSSFGASWFMAMTVGAYKVIHILGDGEWRLAEDKPKKAFG